MLGAVMLLTATVLGPAAAAQSAAANRSVPFGGLVFTVPSSWLVVANSGACLGSRPTMILGDERSFIATQCSALGSHLQPIVTVSASGLPFFGQFTQKKRVTGTNHGVHFAVTYGTMTVKFPGHPPIANRILYATFTGSDVAFWAGDLGAPGSSGFTSVMRIATSVRHGVTTK
jgi:hypothetical protein